MGKFAYPDEQGHGLGLGLLILQHIAFTQAGHQRIACVELTFLTEPLLQQLLKENPAVAIRFLLFAQGKGQGLTKTGALDLSRNSVGHSTDLFLYILGFAFGFCSFFHGESGSLLGNQLHRFHPITPRYESVSASPYRYSHCRQLADRGGR